VSERTARTIGTSAVRRGSSLVEALVAAALVLVLVVGAAALMTLALGAKRKGDLTAALVRALVERIESLKALPFDDPGLQAGSYGATTRVEPRGSPVEETWEIADDGEGLKRLRIRVRPAGRPGLGPAALAVAFISRDLGFGP